MRSIELFAGAGGLGLGVCAAGFKPAAVIEWDRYCCDTIRQNRDRRIDPVAHWPLHEGDVRDYNFEQHRDDVDFLSGGPPCQPFSVGGKHRGNTDRRDMFPEAVRALREVRPRAFLFENVKGLTRATFTNYFEYVRLQMMHPELVLKVDEDWKDHLARLEQHHIHGHHDGLRYSLVTRVLNAADYGVAQRRERVFFVGFRSDLDIQWSFPEPTHSVDALAWDQYVSGEYWARHQIERSEQDRVVRLKQRANRLRGKPNSRPWRTVRDALIELPDPEFRDIDTDRYLNHRFQPGARSYPGHTGSPMDEPAKTLKAGVHGVPGGENMLRRPDGSIRYFSVRESARLQAFPDDFLFHGSWTETMRQLGNAVPVTLARIVAESIRDHLNKDGESTARAA